MPHAERSLLTTARWATLALAGAAAVTALMGLATPAHADASVSISKHLVDGAPAPTKETAQTYAAGSDLTWQYVITNTGDQTLRNARVSDDQGVPVTGCPAVLQPGESGICSGSGEIGAGQYGRALTAPTLPFVGNQPKPTVGQFYEYAIQRTGSPAPTFGLVMSTLPDGLTMSEAGVISGTPTKATRAGGFLTISATNSLGRTTQNLNFWVTDAKPEILTETLPAATAGSAYSTTMTSAANAATWTVSSGALPTGLSLNSTTGTISGTPTSNGVSTFTVSTQNDSGAASKTFSLTVATPVKITSTTIPFGTIGRPYSFTPTATGSGPITWEMVDGELGTPGLTFDPKTGTIAGTPTTDDSSGFTLQATGPGGTDRRTFQLAINIPSPQISGATLPHSDSGVPYSSQITATSDAQDGPLTYVITSGRLPTGLSMSSSGRITGTATLPWTTKNGETTTFAVRVENRWGARASATFTLQAYPDAPPEAPIKGTQLRNVTATGTIKSTSQYCVTSNSNLDLTEWTITGGGGAKLINDPAYVASCKLGITNLTKVGTYTFTLARTNITASKAFDMQVVVTKG